MSSITETEPDESNDKIYEMLVEEYEALDLIPERTVAPRDSPDYQDIVMHSPIYSP